LTRKVRIEFEDDEGTKYSLAVHGHLSRQKVMKAIDLFNIINNGEDTIGTLAPDTNTLYGKLFGLIEQSFSAGDFSSTDISREYEEKFGEPVHLSTVATYLARLVDRGYLIRQRFSNSWVYHRKRLTHQLSSR
jgi:hypothetical protein